MKPAVDREEDVEIACQPCRDAVIEAYRIVTNDRGHDLLKIAGLHPATQNGSILSDNCLHEPIGIRLSGLPLEIGEPAIRISKNLAIANTKAPGGGISQGSYVSSKTPVDFLFCLLAGAVHDVELRTVRFGPIIFQLPKCIIELVAGGAPGDDLFANFQRHGGSRIDVQIIV